MQLYHQSSSIKNIPTRQRQYNICTLMFKMPHFMPLRPCAAKIITVTKKCKNGVCSINKNSNWYYQIQGQLQVTKRTVYLLFGVEKMRNSKLSILKEMILIIFWRDKMEQKLIRFMWTVFYPRQLILDTLVVCPYEIHQQQQIIIIWKIHKLVIQYVGNQISQNFKDLIIK